MELKNLTCKCCTAPLDPVKAVGRVIRCAFCGTAFVLAREDEGKVVDLLRSGELLLDTCKFDDAFTAYAKTAELDKEEPEAYFGMALATFKVQYLKDEVNNRLQPICHEVTDKKFTEDVNYLRAFRYATNEQREEYERKGEEIDYILGEFFKLKQAGLDYDCFLCVKVTDGGGKTEDSKDTDYIYELLRNKGYKPFYSERELRNVTGADYEARILYALYTSECMLVICRDESYLQTKWVKNEYTRFLKLVNDEEKESDSITVVFYEKPIERLPGKKGKLQGIDFSRREADGKIVDFVEAHTPAAKARREAEAKRNAGRDEEIRRQIEEQKRAIENLQKAPDAQGGNVSIANLLTRAKRFEETFDFKQAVEYYNRVLDVQPNHAEAADGLKRAQYGCECEFLGAVLRKYRGKKYAEFEIPRGVTAIGKDAFSEHNELTSITIPDSVKSIESYAFNHCSGLKSITIPDSVTSIGDRAFEGCIGLTSIDIPASVTSIEYGAFLGCSGLTSVNLPESVTSIGDDAFAVCRGLTSVNIPTGVTSIRSGVFRGCSRLMSVKISASVTSIKDRAFCDCNGLKDIEIPANVTLIGAYTFEGCSRLKSITIPDSVTVIGEGAFSGCTRLASVTMPRRLAGGFFKSKLKTYFNDGLLSTPSVNLNKIKFTFTK